MAKNKIERIDQEIEKTREKIAEYQEKLKTLEAQKTEAENLEIVQMVRALRMTPTPVSYTHLKLLRKAGMGGCGSLSGRWLHGAEHGAPRPETDVKGHRAQADKSCDNKRFIKVGSKLLADRHTDRRLLPQARRPLYRHE